MAYKILNLMDMTFGKLKPVRRLDEKSRGSYLWELECDCGKRVFRSSGALNKQEKNGHIQSCGCTREIEIDFTKKYGKLLPIRKLEKDGSYGFLYEFLCDCGNSVIKNGAQVKRCHGALHCGCIENRGGTPVDLRGKVFGELRVTDYAPSGKRGKRRWTCECSCGKIITVSGAEITIRKRHCGCKRKYGCFNKSFRGVGQLYQSYWTRVQKGAEIRGFVFDINREYVITIFKLQEGKCALSGVPIELGIPGKQQTASLDRIDSKIGYIEGNIQWVHKQINVCKQDLQDEDFIEWCGRVWAYRSGTSVGS